MYLFWVHFRDELVFVSNDREEFKSFLKECDGILGMLTITDYTESEEWV